MRSTACLSTVICRSWPVVQAKKVPVRGFVQTSKPTENSFWEHWHPDFAWLPVRRVCGGGFNLCCDEEFEKAVAEIQHDTDHLTAVVARQWPEVSDFVAHFCTLRVNARVKKHTDMRESHAQRAKKCDTNHIYVVKLPSGRGSRMKRWCKHFTPFQRIPVVCNVCILYISPSLLRVLLIFRRHLW